MPRFIFGPHIGPVELIVAAPAPVAPIDGVKADVSVAFAGYTPEGLFKFDVPAHDLATHNQLTAIHVSLYEHGAAVPTDPAEAVGAQLHYATPIADQAGGPMQVDATEAPVGTFTALAILEFAE